DRRIQAGPRCGRQPFGTRARLFPTQLPRVRHQPHVDPKQQSITALFTSTTPTLLGGGSVTEKHISTLTDSIILLRYVESLGQMRRSINVLKMRGSPHDSNFREFTIDGRGMHIGEPFRDVSGILTGNPQMVLTGHAGEG